MIREDLASSLLPYESDNHLNWITHIPGRPQNCGMDEVSICFAHSRNCFPLDNKDLTRMYFEGRDQATMLAEYIKKRVPGFENSFLTTTASLLGVRESRRIVGEYRLTAEDIAFCRKHDDVIAISNHGYDIHNFVETGNIKWAPIMLNGEVQYVISNSGGFGTTTPPPDGKPVVNAKGQTAEYAEFEPNRCYDIPYRCLVPVRVENLLVAGRNLSSDVYAQSGARLILCCLSMGEAAGAAVCVSIAQDISPRKIDVTALQKELIGTGCNLGQAMRHIKDFSGVSLGYEEAYPNPEHRSHAVTIQNRSNEFTRK
ncbi:MAG: FAD-dependent oxidoreductase [Oscillospiraceae bacterium]|nr:FAD-dependent oxidoreductase [Oscillospiraceae bacterium]